MNTTETTDTGQEVYKTVGRLRRSEEKRETDKMAKTLKKAGADAASGTVFNPLHYS